MFINLGSSLGEIVGEEYPMAASCSLYHRFQKLIQSECQEFIVPMLNVIFVIKSVAALFKQMNNQRCSMIVINYLN